MCLIYYTFSAFATFTFRRVIIVVSYIFSSLLLLLSFPPLLRRRSILLTLPQLLLHTPAHGSVRCELLSNTALLVERPSDLLCCASDRTARHEVFANGAVG